MIGYDYDQSTADSGAGARLGAFEARSRPLGDGSYTFLVGGKLPVSTRVNVYQEFDVTNRLAATTGFLTVSLPIAISN